MVLVYLDCCGGLNIFEAPNGDVYLHHPLENVLIGPLDAPDDAREVAHQVLH